MTHSTSVVPLRESGSTRSSQMRCECDKRRVKDATKGTLRMNLKIPPMRRKAFNKPSRDGESANCEVVFSSSTLEQRWGKICVISHNLVPFSFGATLSATITVSRALIPDSPLLSPSPPQSTTHLATGRRVCVGLCYERCSRNQFPSLTL